DGIATASSAVGQIRAQIGPSSLTGKVRLSIRPELIRVVRGAPAGVAANVNRVTGAILASSFLGQSSEHLVSVGAGQFRMLCAPPQYNLKGAVSLEFDAADVVVLAR